MPEPASLWEQGDFLGVVLSSAAPGSGAAQAKTPKSKRDSPAARDAVASRETAAKGALAREATATGALAGAAPAEETLASEIPDSSEALTGALSEELSGALSEPPGLPLPQTISLPNLPSPTPRGLPPCPERLLIVDTETTGLSPAKGRCIEVGAVLFHVPSRAVLSQLSFLLPCSSNPAERVNGIAAAVTRLEQPRGQFLACLEAMAAAADVLVAHNAAFDRQWFGREELPPLQRPWLCSMEDIRWPAERHLRATPSVRDLALAYGVPVWAAHRALTDCIYIAQVFEREAQLETLLQQALLPRKLYRARLPYDQRHLAKEAGFRWNEGVQGAWSKRLTEAERGLLPFEVLPAEADQSANWPQPA
jgi:DNA polymerase-3 subunit epsilon